MATEDFSNSRLTALQRQLQRRTALLVLGINICRMHEETFHHVPMPLVCRNVQWGVIVPAVGVGSVSFHCNFTTQYEIFWRCSPDRPHESPTSSLETRKDVGIDQPDQHADADHNDDEIH